MHESESNHEQKFLLGFFFFLSPKIKSVAVKEEFRVRGSEGKKGKVLNEPPGWCQPCGYIC